MPSDNVYDYGCLSLKCNINPTDWGNFTKRLLYDDLYITENGYGIEDDPHITVLYGLHRHDDIAKKISNYTRKITHFNLAVNKLDCFTGDEYDVLKFNILGRSLYDLNALIRSNFKFTSNFPNYQPHMTVAYLKPGKGAKYIKDLSKPYKLSPAGYEYSSPDNIVTKISLWD